MEVNDGKGLYDSSGMIDSLIVDCNSLLGFLISNQNIAFCKKIVEMVQKLSNLKTGIKTDTESMTEQIQRLLEERGNADVQC